ncbi:MAG: hypothetical protein DME09_01805 [Candidatus Rokuibacteriota bacterium]|nr:MAG: hypothetical protein DME09_01805 [Candidatus Rokubacteria bacterium]
MSLIIHTRGGLVLAAGQAA